MAIRDDGPGLLEDFRAVNGVAEDNVRPVQVKSIPPAPWAGQGTEGFRSWIGEFALRVGPAGHLRQADFLFTDDLRMRAVSAVEGDAAGADESARPTGGHAEQISIEENVGVRREADGQTFQGHIVRGPLGGNAGALEWRRAVQKAGSFTRLARAMGLRNGDSDDRSDRENES